MSGERLNFRILIVDDERSIRVTLKDRECLAQKGVSGAKGEAPRAVVPPETDPETESSKGFFKKWFEKGKREVGRSPFRRR